MADVDFDAVRVGFGNSVSVYLCNDSLMLPRDITAANEQMRRRWCLLSVATQELKPYLVPPDTR